MSTSATTLTPPADAPTAHAPGKLILSGEHAVVYGAPALAVAVAQYTEVWFRPVHRSEGLITAFEQISKGEFYPLTLLNNFKQKLDQRFEQFARGELPVQNILHRPDDLVIYTMASMMQRLPVPGISPNRNLPVPGKLSSRSDLPLGAGMGSSAAAIAATFVLYENLLSQPQTPDERFERVRFCERLQHGKGGAIDAATVVYGGVNRVEDGRISKPNISSDHGLWNGTGWYWVLDGVPASSTGECVSAVRSQVGNDTALWTEFADCTGKMQSALETNTDPSDCIKHNHRLLQRIGVVPEKTAAFVAEVEKAGGAAKICGAGSVRGTHGGAVLVHLKDAETMVELMKRHTGKRWDRLRIAPAGALSGAAP